jgi:hypothetical protein
MLIVNGVIAAREKGREVFKDQMCQKDDRAEFLRAKLLHRRSVTTRQFYAKWKDRTIDLAWDSGQEWVDIGIRKAEVLTIEAALAEKRQINHITPEDKPQLRNWQDMTK